MRSGGVIGVIVVILIVIGTIWNCSDDNGSGGGSSVTTQSDRGNIVTIEGVWQRNPNRSSDYPHVVEYQGNVYPFIVRDGESLVGKQVRVKIEYTGKGRQFRVVSLDVIGGQAAGGTSGTNSGTVTGGSGGTSVTTQRPPQTDIVRVNALLEDIDKTIEQVQGVVNAQYAQQDLIDDKIDDLRFIRSDLRQDEIQRISDARDAALRELNTIARVIDDKPQEWRSRFSTITFASSSDRAGYRSQMDGKISRFEADVPGDVAELRRYFESLNPERL